MEKPVQWMTLQELRVELGRTRPAWDELAELDDIDLENGHLPSLGVDAHRHQLVQRELLDDRAMADSTWREGTVTARLETVEDDLSHRG